MLGGDDERDAVAVGTQQHHHEAGKGFGNKTLESLVALTGEKGVRTVVCFPRAFLVSKRELLSGGGK